MSIIFQNSFILPLLALAAAPLILHLFARTKPPEYIFSSNEFIMRVVRRRVRFRKPQDILLLILRTLIFLSVITAFASPLFFSDSGFAGFKGRRNVVILADASASMGYAEGGQTRFASACAEASEILSGLSKGDRANIVWIKASPKTVFPAPGENIAYLRDELRRAAVTNQRGDAASAFREAVAMLEKLEGGKEIFIVSDFQKTQWKDVKTDAAPGVNVAAIKIGRAPAANRGVTKIYTDPLLPLVGEDVGVFCEVSNYSPEPWSCSISFQSRDSRSRRQIMVPPWGKASSIFRLAAREQGSFPFEAVISEDFFPGDNRRCGKIAARKYLNAAVVAEEQIPARYWLRALKTLPWMKAENLPASEIRGGAGFDLLMLSGWQGTSAAEDAKMLGEGTAVFCAPGDRLSPATLANLAGEKNGALSKEPFVRQKTDGAFRLKLAKPDDRAFAVFTDGRSGDPAGGALKSRLLMDAKDFPGAEMLISYDDGVPALFRFGIQGNLYVWNISLHPEDGNWAGRPQFVPLLSELALSGKRAGGRTDAIAENFPGRPLSMRADFLGGGSGAEVVLSDPAGAKIPCRADESGGRLVFISGPVENCGVYSWSLNGKEIECSTVNFPADESDLRCFDEPEIKGMSVFAAGGGGRIRSLHEGVELWPYLIFAAFLFCFMEQFVMLWAEKT